MAGQTSQLHQANFLRRSDFVKISGPSDPQYRILMFHVYVIVSERAADRYYIGFSSRPDDRLAEHNGGKNSYTDESLRWLQSDYIDLLLVHWPRGGASIEEQIEGLNRVVDAGKVRHIGVHNYNVAMMQIAVNISKPLYFRVPVNGRNGCHLLVWSS